MGLANFVPRASGYGVQPKNPTQILPSFHAFSPCLAPTSFLSEGGLVPSPEAIINKKLKMVSIFVTFFFGFLICARGFIICGYVSVDVDLLTVSGIFLELTVIFNAFGRFLMLLSLMLSQHGGLGDMDDGQWDAGVLLVYNIKISH